MDKAEPQVRERTFPMHGLAILVCIMMVADLLLVFIAAPQERIMGDVQRIFYLHVPLAWSAFLAFFVTFIYSIRFLVRRDQSDDRWAACSAEIGLLFTTLVLVTGALWAKKAWGTYWTWEPRLTTAFILWIMYVFYWLLRKYMHMEVPEQAKVVSAVYGIVGFLNVPIVFMSIRWWRTIHPVVITSRGFNMEKSMVLVLGFSLVTFMGVYLLLLRERVSIARLQDRLEGYRDQIIEERG
jgi:heme exporter protein C